MAFEGTQGGLGGFGLSLGAAAQQGAGTVVAACLGDGGAVDGGVELPVPAPVQAEHLPGPARGRDGGGPVVPGVGGLAAEPADVAGLAQDPRGGDHADPAD